MNQTIGKISQTLMESNKGILAADESKSTMSKRLASIDVEDTEENGRRFRDLLFTTPDVEKYLSGVILFDTTIRQTTSDGTPFAEYLASKGIVPGIKVDKGLQPLPNFPDEEISHGLDSLREDLKEYYALGARFTKWRSVIRIGDELPTDTALRANAHVLAYYASIVQENNMVPMVEPEVLFDGKHTLPQSAEALRRTLSILFETLSAYRVSLPSLILKTSMALPGRESGIALDPRQIAEETVLVLKDTVPSNVGGVVFLSGGQTPLQATQNLNAIGKMGEMYWPLTFSYSRALEEPVLEVWKGLDNNRVLAQQAFLHRLELSALARSGQYIEDME
jgi:fructose-bisphosphate aldolase class I